MRSAPQMIRSALADPDFAGFEPDDSRNVGRLHFFGAKLPREKYIGLPEQWYFGILLEPEKPTSREESQVILTNARTLIRDSIAHRRVPLLLLSDDPDVKLADNLRWENQNVFFIDRHKLPGAKNYPAHLRAAPFLRAVREKIDRKDLSALFFEPYRPGEPAEGWRFFGRRAELERIVSTGQSFVVIGARRIGKTSLLKEAQRQLENIGAKVYFLSVADLNSAQQVVESLMRVLSPRDMNAAIRRQKALNESMLRTVLRTISREHERVTLIIDELGNVIQKSRQDDWRIMGVFREYAHSSRLQVIMSGHQEFFLKQLQDFGGPFVNLADVIRLGVFSDSEVEEFLIDPLILWGTVRDRRKLRDLVIANVGKQPFLLQHLGRALFQRLFRSGAAELEAALLDLLSNDLTRAFDTAIDEAFYHITTAAQRYLFLRRCVDCEAAGQDPTTVEITDTWTRDALTGAGFESSFDGRRLLLESMELVGLTASVANNRSRQLIVSPIIWKVIKASASVEELISTFSEEIGLHRDRLTVHATQ
jgi:hypothetical protein